MKKDTHPKYDEATISCACGHVLKTHSTVKSMSINTCAACHPYFTGQAKFIDTEGRVDRFNKRYARKAIFRKLAYADYTDAALAFAPNANDGEAGERRPGLAILSRYGFVGEPEVTQLSPLG